MNAMIVTFALRCVHRMAKTILPFQFIPNFIPYPAKYFYHLGFYSNEYCHFDSKRAINSLSFFSNFFIKWWSCWYEKHNGLSIYYVRFTKRLKFELHFDYFEILKYIKTLRQKNCDGIFRKKKETLSALAFSNALIAIIFWFYLICIWYIFYCAFLLDIAWKFILSFFFLNYNCFFEYI